MNFLDLAGVPKPLQKPIYYLGFGIIVLVILLIVKSQIKSLFDGLHGKSFDNDAGKTTKSGINVNEYVVRFYEALYGPDDEDALYQIAKEINLSDFDNICSSFRKLYGDGLQEWLADDLDGDELQKFYSILKTAK